MIRRGERFQVVTTTAEAEFGPVEFWRKTASMRVRARAAGREYLTWPEYAMWRRLAEVHGMFDVVGRGPRETTLPARVGPMSMRYGVISGALIEQFRRARDAQDAGDSAEQFARDERISRGKGLSLASIPPHRSSAQDAYADVDPMAAYA